MVWPHEFETSFLWNHTFTSWSRTPACHFAWNPKPCFIICSMDVWWNIHFPSEGLELSNWNNHFEVDVSGTRCILYQMFCEDVGDSQSFFNFYAFIKDICPWTFPLFNSTLFFFLMFLGASGHSTLTSLHKEERTLWPALSGLTCPQAFWDPMIEPSGHKEAQHPLDHTSGITW